MLMLLHISDLHFRLKQYRVDQRLLSSLPKATRMPPDRSPYSVSWWAACWIGRPSTIVS